MDKVFTQVAQESYTTGAELPHLLTSSMDMAHRVGLWCKANNVYPVKVHESRGYSWKINNSITISFKANSRLPQVVA